MCPVESVTACGVNSNFILESAFASSPSGLEAVALHIIHGGFVMV